MRGTSPTVRHPSPLQGASHPPGRYRRPAELQCSAYDSLPGSPLRTCRRSSLASPATSPSGARDRAGSVDRVDTHRAPALESQSRVRSIPPGRLRPLGRVAQDHRGRAASLSADSAAGAEATGGPPQCCTSSSAVSTRRGRTSSALDLPWQEPSRRRRKADARRSLSHRSPHLTRTSRRSGSLSHAARYAGSTQRGSRSAVARERKN